MRQSRYDGLHNQLMNFAFQSQYIDAFLLKQTIDGSERSFMPLGHIVVILVEHEFLAFLVDRVIGQMHADVIDVVLVGGHVCLSGEPS